MFLNLNVAWRPSQVTTPKGASVEINTDGVAHLVPPPVVARWPPPSKLRGVATHGAPVPPGENLAAPPSVTRRTVLPDGSLVTAYADGSSEYRTPDRKCPSVLQFHRTALCRLAMS